MAYKLYGYIRIVGNGYMEICVLFGNEGQERGASIYFGGREQLTNSYLLLPALSPLPPLGIRRRPASEGL
jgi:hypothetical protein